MNLYRAQARRLGWHKASFCQGGECVEIAKQDNMIFLRNSRKPGETVRYTADEWQAFANGLRRGEFNDLG